MLPIGSIVYLKEGSQKLMIINRGSILESNHKKELYDYCACNYPLGVYDDEAFHFNEENIDKIVFKGYVDDDEIRFQEIYEDMVNKVGNNVSKGKTERRIEGLN